jgi:hypothetical protein
MMIGHFSDAGYKIHRVQKKKNQRMAKEKTNKHLSRAANSQRDASRLAKNHG